SFRQRFDRKTALFSDCAGGVSSTSSVYGGGMSEPYPRDMVGYGGNPPQAQWPGGARLALQIVVNYEEGGENAILHGDHASEDFEREHLHRAIAVITRLTGQRPLGWYTGRTSEHTQRLVAEEGGFLYDADSYADDLPYWVKLGGRDHLVVPYTLDANDMRFAT